MSDLKPEDLININSMNTVKPKAEPKVDKLVSKAVGKTIYTTNPKLMTKIAEWKREKGDDIDPANPKMDNFLDDPKKVEELRKIL